MPAVIGEFDGEFDPYIKSWETEKLTDPSIPQPTDSQKKLRDDNMREGNYNDIIEELTDEDEDFMFAAEKGLDMLKFLANYTDGISDITQMNFKTSEHILRFNKRAKNSFEFENNMGYIGTLAASIKNVNHKVKIVPTVDNSGNWEYKGEDFYNLSEVIDYLDRIDIISKEMELNFDEIHDIQPQTSCISAITQAQRVVREGFLGFRSYVVALN